MATRSARTADKSINDKHTRILKALLQKPGNKYCVDCRKKDPRWASFNLGCFMCIRCSGVHRSMGTHISKVKSVDLDSWTTDQMENMIKWGNEKANLYWEARLPETSIPNENTSGIDPWIRSKYEWKQFTNKEPIPDPSELGPIDEAMLMDLTQPNKRTSIPPPPQQQQQHSSQNSASQDLFSLVAPAPSASVQATPSNSVQTQSTKGGNGDWKNSIMSLYGNQASTSNRNSAGFAIGQQMQHHQPQQQQAGQFGQLQGMGAFDYSQKQQHQQQNHQQQFQQQHAWNDHSGFGVMQQAPGQHSLGSSGMGSTFGGGQGGPMGRPANTAASGGMGMGMSMGSSSSGSTTTPQGGDFFSMIAGATQTPAVSPPAQKKNSR
ncbi:hypothetical protein BGZ70_000520 [Mortierella alpina]|uniref:Arf-GAP domain-containing protein n=1 Tax=Mortierella alpina TaxID=64518 RepID=A0A9P6M5V6_MORAP|nr:hypothetical protein BGZ70_000520 [Mortierella alpina]